MHQVRPDYTRAIGALRAALIAERDALVTGDPDLLEAATLDKHAAAHTLESMETDRAELGFELDADLLAEAAACRDLNVANGHLLSVKSRQVTSTLNILRGVEGASQLYGPDGHCKAPPAPRSLVSA